MRKYAQHISPGDSRWRHRFFLLQLRGMIEKLKHKNVQHFRGKTNANLKLTAEKNQSEWVDFPWTKWSLVQGWGNLSLVGDLAKKGRINRGDLSS
jgi:hypothetical protein